MLVQFAVSAYFTTGVARMYLTAVRGQEPEFGVLFSGADRLVPVFLTFLLLGIIVGIGTVLLVVPGVIAALGLAFAYYYVIDRSEGPVEGLRSSWEATSGQKGKIFLFGLAAFGIYLAGLIACGIGVLVAGPIIGLASAIIYTRISGTGGALPAPGAQPVGPHGFGGGGMPAGVAGAPPGAPMGGAPMGMHPGAPQGMHPGAPQGMHPGAPQGVHQGAPQGMHQGAPQGMHPGAPQGMHPGAPQGMPPGAPQGMPPGAPYGAPPGAPQAPYGAPQPGMQPHPGVQPPPGVAAPPGVGPAPGGAGPGGRRGPGGTQIIEQFDPNQLKK